MELDLFETPGTKQVTKSKKRRSVRIRRKSTLLGYGLVCDEDKTDDMLPVESHSQDVNISALASDVGQVCEEKNLQASGNQYGSVWMDTDSPEMAELVIRRNRRKSRVHLPIMSVIDRIESPSVLTEVDPDLNINDLHLSVELSRTGDMSDSTETNGMGSRLSGSYIVAPSPLVDTSGTSGSEHRDVRFNQQQENDFGSTSNSFSEYLPSDNSTASLSPCFEASDYNVGGKTFQYFNSSSRQTQNSSDSCKVGRINSTEDSKYLQSCGSDKMVLSLAEENRTLPGITQDLTSRMTPVDKKSGLASDLISSLTPYSPSQPIFKNISPPNCESPNSTFSPVYLTPADKVTRSKVTLDGDNDDEDIWKTCKKTIVPKTEGHIGVTPGTGTNIRTKTLKSNQKKSSRSTSKSSSEVPSKQQTSGFLSICRSLAGKLANAVRNSPDNERSNPMSLSDQSFTSIKPQNTSNKGADVILNSQGKDLGSVVSVSTADNSDTGITVSTPVNTNLLSLGDGKNLSSAFSYERKSGKTLNISDSMKGVPSFLPLPQDKVDDTYFCASENTGPCGPVQDSGLASVPEAVKTNGEKLTNTSDTPKNPELCSSTTDIDTTSKDAKSDSEEVKDIQDSNRPAMSTISQSQTPKYSDEVIAHHLEVCFDYLDSEPLQENHNKTMAELGTQTGHHSAKSISLESAEHATVVESLDTVDITSRAAPVKVRKVQTKQKRTGRKSMGLVSQESPGCELSESVNKLSLNTVSDMDTCVHVVSKDNYTDSGIKQKESESANVSSTGCEPISTHVESDLMSTLPSVNEVKKRGYRKKSKTVLDKTATMSSEPIPPCEENDPLPSVTVVKKRSRSRKSMSLIPPVVVEPEVSNVHLSLQPGSELQETSLPQLVNNKTGEDSTSLQNNTSDCKPKSIDNIKVLTAEDLKSLDEYLGIKDPDPVIVPPTKKRGRPRKSVDGCVQTQTKAADLEAVNKNLASVEKSVTGTTEEEVNVSQRENSWMTDVQTIIKDPLVAELEDLELLERPKRKSSRIQRRSIEIYRQIQTANSAEEDVPMSPLETVEESKQTTAVLQDVSSNHGNNRNNQDSTTKIARKRKLTKNEPSVEDIYKNKNFKRPAPKIWETIYEIPAEEQLFSKKRFRRSVMFDESLIVPPAKTKMRLRKAIKNGMDPRQRRKKMLSDLAVKKKLAKMEAVLEDDD